jgi:K+-sensing histidine kinase KdpD
VVWVATLAGPSLLTLSLVHWGGSQRRDYVFLYLGLVAIVAFQRGIRPAAVAGGISFILVDFYFVPPVGTLRVSDPQDLVNLGAFVVAVVSIGLLASLRRESLLHAQALTRQLREANGELVRLNHEQAEAAQAAVRLARSEHQIRALQEADRLRRELLANVSHELRTPLGTILAQSSDASVSKLGLATVRRFQTIAAEARRLESLVNGMLDMARIESGALELNLEPVGLGDAIAAAIERLQRVHPDRPMRWSRRGASVEVLADWTRLGQILDNLLRNADRFGPAGTPIWIEVERQGGELIAISVSDQGPGVDPEMRERVFERFTRLREDDAQSGSGLGLAIVRGLVEAHAGTVELELHGHKGGATFTFTLPEIVP